MNANENLEVFLFFTVDFYYLFFTAAQEFGVSVLLRLIRFVAF